MTTGLPPCAAPPSTSEVPGIGFPHLSGRSGWRPWMPHSLESTEVQRQHPRKPWPAPGARLAQWTLDNDIGLTLFHGRGGGPMGRAILAQPPGSVAGSFKVTERGRSSSPATGNPPSRASIWSRLAPRCSSPPTLALYHNERRSQQPIINPSPRGWTRRPAAPRSGRWWSPTGSLRGSPGSARWVRSAGCCAVRTGTGRSSGC